MKKILLIISIFLFITPFLVIVGALGGSSISNGNGSAQYNIYVNYPQYDNGLNNRVPQLVYATNGRKVNSAFGGRYDPKSGVWTNHNGTDFGCSYGDPIYAVAPGVVTLNGKDIYGALIIAIEHNPGVITRYVHMQAVYVVKGQEVWAGQQIGECGSTGYSTGPHLHLTLRIDGQDFDIVPYLQYWNREK